MVSRTVTPAEQEIEQLAEGFDEEAAWIKVRFRGVTYHFRELGIDDYRSCEKRATVKRNDPDTGIETEVVDQQLLDTFMIAKSMVEPQPGQPGFRPIGQLGTRLFLALRRTVQRLHFGDELDELRATKKKADDDEKDEGQGNQ